VIPFYHSEQVLNDLEPKKDVRDGPEENNLNGWDDFKFRE